MFEKIQAYLASQLDIPADEITRDTTFESLGVDSLDTVEMVMDLEEQLGVDLELEDKPHGGQALPVWCPQPYYRKWKDNLRSIFRLSV